MSVEEVSAVVKDLETAKKHQHTLMEKMRSIQQDIDKNEVTIERLMDVLVIKTAIAQKKKFSSKCWNLYETKGNIVQFARGLLWFGPSDAEEFMLHILRTGYHHYHSDFLEVAFEHQGHVDFIDKVLEHVSENKVKLELNESFGVSMGIIGKLEFINAFGKNGSERHDETVKKLELLVKYDLIDYKQVFEQGLSSNIYDTYHDGLMYLLHHFSIKFDNEFLINMIALSKNLGSLGENYYAELRTKMGEILASRNVE